MIKMRREKQNKIIQYDQKRHKKKFKKKRKGFNPNPVGDMGVGVGGDAKMDCLNGLRWFEMKGKDAYNLHPLVKGTIFHIIKPIHTFQYFQMLLTFFTSQKLSSFFFLISSFCF